jgi:hypothetical protein
MLSASECLLKANNLEMAARTAGPHDQVLYLQAAAEWRMKARKADTERPDPFLGDLARGDASQLSQPAKTAD